MKRSSRSSYLSAPKKIDLVVLAGYMLLIGQNIVEKFKNRIINIHPVLLPSFKGTHGIKDAFDMGIFNCMLNTPFQAILAEKLGSYKGFLAENFVAQELYSYLNEDLIAWAEGRSEIEFLISKEEHIIPLEVKSSSRSRKAKSLDSFISRYNPQRGYKLSGQNFGKQEKRAIITLPVYFCGKLVKND